MVNGANNDFLISMCQSGNNGFTVVGVSKWIFKSVRVFLKASSTLPYLSSQSHLKTLYSLKRNSAVSMFGISQVSLPKMIVFITLWKSAYLAI